MHQLDDSFKEAKEKRARRRRAKLLRRLAIGSSTLFVIGIGLFAILEQPLWQGWLGWTNHGPAVPIEDVGQEPAVYIPAIVDLAGDPMKISLGDDLGAGQVTRFVPRPAEVPIQRITEQVAVLTDVMITTSQRFMTTLPSSPKDFAFYQAQRTSTPPLKTPASPPEPSAVTPTDAASASADPAAVPTSAFAADATAEDTTSVAVVRPEAVRFAPDAEYKARIKIDQSLDSLMTENNFSPQDAAVFSQAMSTLLQRSGLDAGDIVAIRGVRESANATVLRPVQMSLYNNGAWVGTLSRTDEGTVEKGADPWVFDNLFNYSGQEDVAQPGRQYRLLDAIYSTAVRNRVPTGVLGEAIMLLSRSFDLSAFATTSDKLVIAYARDGDGDDGGTGRVLYVSVQGPDRNLQCYVFKLATDGDYSCFTATNRGQSIAVASGMLVPVRGSLTTPFGPAVDPSTRQKFNNTGVDWAAPVGTPVNAAFAGTVSFVGDGGDAGNLVTISHAGGRETTYGSLEGFAAGLAKGAKVAAGDLIGYVGATGKSVSPHLHFELHVGGAPIDPLQTEQSNTDDDAAVTTLVDQIVRVESAGNATAQNPLSSAYGLGQFISSTWLRMMQTYRPDLYGSMSQAELLALRADPTLAREMVTNLAREGEAYLRARGEAITAGTLYLCHFLGMEGAAIVLAAAPETPIETLVTPGVLSANPTILPGRSASQVAAWAEGVMNHHGGPSVPAAPPVPPEFKIYQAAIDTMLAPAPPMQTAAIN